MTKPIKTENTGTCQICERACKLPNGRVSLHGYKRPGTGWITGNCRGSHELPFEQSCDALVRFIETVLVARRANLLESLAELPTLTEVIEYPRYGGRVTGEPKTYHKGETQINSWGCQVDGFAAVVAHRETEWTYEIKRLDAEIARQSLRVAGWKASV